MKCKPMPLRSFASPPINEQRRQSRINFSTIKMVHKCNHCSESYSSSSALFNHKRSIHKDQFMLKCMHCKAMFCMFKRFCSHLRRYHINKKSFKCTFCARNFYMMGKLINHMRTHVTDQKSHKSSGCEETFDTLSELRNGSSSRKLKNQSPSPNSDDCEETSEVFACTRCGKEFTTTSLLSSHVCARGGTKSHACVLCRQVFLSVRRLQKHLICHAGEAYFPLYFVCL
jgi:KRAB domain-containing zinc finger protein